MPEAAHVFGSDLQLSATGDLLLIDGVEQTRQRVLRRLLTNQGAYLWNLAYGAGLPSQVGLKANGAAIAALVRSQMFQEAAVAQTLPPTITVSVNRNGVVICNITYTDLTVNQQVSLTFPIVATNR